MVICKYFLRNTCRFGENCKNEHTYADNSASMMRRKSDVDINVLIKAVSNDMDRAEKGNQWPLSCYGPFQGKPCFPGFEDKSFEEIRLGMYDAEKTGSVEQYKQYLTKILQDARIKMTALLNPSAEAICVLQELYSAIPLESQTQNIYSASNNVFASPATNTNSIFGNTGNVSSNIFGNQQPLAPTNNTANNFAFALPTENKSVFGGPSNVSVNTGSLFGNATQQQLPNRNIFGGVAGSGAQQTTNVFGAPPSTFSAAPVANIFQTANQQNVFGNAAPNQAVAGGNLFASSAPQQQPQQQQQQQQNLFAQNTQTTNIFKQAAQAAFGPPQQTNQQSVFGAAAVSQTQSPFGISNQAVFGSNQNAIFANNNSSNNQSPFGTNQSIFSTVPSNVNTNSNSNVFGSNQSTFGQTPIAQTNQNVFGQQTTVGNVFGSVGEVAIPTPQQDDVTIYSRPEDLTENEIKCFEATDFEFGQISSKPPTLQMCF